jgi:eukaryotic translation initiation factor 2-alpha kinase 4
MSLNTASRGAALLLGGATGWSTSTNMLLGANSNQLDSFDDAWDELGTDAPPKQTAKPLRTTYDPFGFGKKPQYNLSNASISSVSPASRFKREFVKLADLGRGGFGRVVKARNVIDGQQYAVKKIKLGASPAVLEAAADVMNSLPVSDVDVSIGHLLGESASVKKEAKSDFGKSKIDLLREARVMAQICRHRNLVRYYQSWLEIERVDSDEELSDSECSEDFDDSDSESDEGLKSPFQLVLFIQMQYCNSETLKDFLLESRTDESLQTQSQTDQRWDLVRQILCGLDHIHRRGYLHFDLTPSNIFLKKKRDGGFHVKLGDFGLSSPKRDGPPSADLQQGSLLYMSPERMDPKVKLFDEKVDIYAVGAIMLELFYGFSTEMERIHVLTQLRLGKLPADISTRVDLDVVKVIRIMTGKTPSERPSAGSLLSSPSFLAPHPSPQNSTASLLLVNQLKEKDEQLKRQQELIERLQKQLQGLKST